MIGDALQARGIAVVLDGRRFLRSRGDRLAGGTVRASGSDAPLAEQITAAVDGIAPAAFVTLDGTVWVLDEVAASDVVYAGTGDPNEAQTVAVDALVDLLDATATARPARRRRSKLVSVDPVDALESPTEPVAPIVDQPEDAVDE